MMSTMSALFFQHVLQTQGSHIHLDELTMEEDFEPDYLYEQDTLEQMEVSEVCYALCILIVRVI